MEYNSTIQQGSLDWLRERLGKFTGSKIADLMGKGKGKEPFSQTALKYIYQVVAERNLDTDKVDDDIEFQQYLYYNNPSSRYMEWGHTQETNARALYEISTGNTVFEVDSIAHPTIGTFAASPDGYIVCDESRGVLEIKCPAPATYIQYTQITDGESLKAINPTYYYQVMSEMAVTGAQWCDFVVYCPWLADKVNLHIVHIERNDDAIKAIEQRVLEAEEFINNNFKL